MTIRDYVPVSMGKKKSEVVLKNARVINVFDQSIENCDIAIEGEIIVGLGSYQGEIEIDCSGCIVAPGLIDTHVHIESSMVTPEVFSQIVLAHGVTTAITDPHEIANVLGVKGIDFMIKNSEKSVMDLFFMLPSCVPATEFEDNGANLTSIELEPFLKNNKVLGLGEVMDVQSVTQAKDNMIDKIMAVGAKNKDGHCPSIAEKELNAYLCCGINTDHECSCYEEALQKIKRGMYVMLREGSATKNILDILPAVRDNNYSRFLFCTDDRHLEDLISEGTIDNCLKVAVKNGLDPIRAITIATLNGAQCYGLKDRGAVAPGLLADLVVFEDLVDFKIKKVFKKGKEFKHNMSFTPIPEENSIHAKEINSEDFKVPYGGDKINLIKLKPYSVETLKVQRIAKGEEGYITSVEGEDISKLAVIERHRDTGKMSICYLEGLGLKNCSIAQTIAHDSHNIIVLGDSDSDMALAVNTLRTIGGGIVMVSKGEVIEALNLPIGGLITSEDPGKVVLSLGRLNEAAKKFGVKKEYDAFLTLGFMALPVIPEIKLTARGLFDYTKFSFIDLFTI